MKVNVEIDCTPDEARRFLGLPDVAPMQETVMAAMEQRLLDTIKATDSQTLLDQWLPLGMKGMEQWQAMWTQVAQAAAGLPLPLPRTSCPCALPRALAAKSGQDQIRIAKLSLPPVTTQPAAPNPGYASTIRSPKPEASADTNMGRIPKPDVFAGTNMGRIPKPDAFTGTDTDRLPIPERLTLPVDNPVPVPACACAQEPSLKVEAQFQVAIRGSQAPVLTPAADDVLACQSLLPSAHQCLDRPDFLATTKESPSLAECTFAPLDCRPLCFVFGT